MMQSRRKKSTLLQLRDPVTPRIRRQRRKRRKARKKKYRTSSEESSSAEQLEKVSPYKRQKLEYEKVVRHQRWLDSLFPREKKEIVAISKTEQELFKENVVLFFQCFGYIANAALLFYLFIG